LWKQRQFICPKLPTEKREWQTVGAKVGAAACAAVGAAVGAVVSAVGALVGAAVGALAGAAVCSKKLFPPVTESLAGGKAQLDKRNDMLCGKGGDKDVMLLRSTQFLFKEYEPRYWWFEVFECVRRIMLTGGSAMFFEGSSSQVAFGMLISIIAIHVYATTRPYINRRDDLLAMAAQWGIFFTLFGGLLLKTKVPSGDGYEGGLESMLLLVNVAVFVIAVGVLIFLVYQKQQKSNDGALPLAAPGEKGEASARTTSSSVGSTRTNPMMAGIEYPPSNGKPLAKGGSSLSKESRAKLSKKALEIYATTSPATQGNNDSEQNPTAQL
jgi:hypothetical protein